jgi:hypothetical protein
MAVPEIDAPVTAPWRFMARRRRPSVIPAAAVQASTAVFTQAEAGGGAQAAVLAAEIRDHPSAIALLEVPHLDAGCSERRRARAVWSRCL